MIGSMAFTSTTYLDAINSFDHHSKTQPLGISIVLYRVGKADKIEELSNLDRQMDKSRSVDLYKITQDLGIIFMNTANPYRNTDALPYKMLFGNYVEKQVGDKTINGFVPVSEVAAICDWIKKHRIDTFQGFERMYDSLSEEAKLELEDIGADGKKPLFDGYVQPLTQFYFAALKEKNSIVICGE
jgi:hypothetical protein